MIVDSHCHLELNKDIGGILERAQAAGVGWILSLACNSDELPDLIALLNSYPCVYGAFGFHPEHAAACPNDADLTAQITSHPKIVGVGECGLDYHYDPNSRDIQMSVFERQIELAHRLKKPVIIHTRDAESDTISILQNAHRAGRLKYGGVLHCFTGSWELARRALDFGLHLSASGIITFKKADALRDVFARLPPEKLLVETDAPYLAPLAHRGQENEPAFVAETVACLADLHHMSPDKMADITTANFKKLFQIQEGA